MLRKSTIEKLKKTLSLLLLMVLPCLLSAQNNSGLLWTDIDESEIEEVGTRYTIPLKYRTLKLDVDEMRAALDKAPMTKTPDVRNSPAFLEIPWPDGSTKTFRIIESPIMAPELMAIYPEIKTYAGSEVGDPTKYIRLDLTPQGFHAMVLTAGEGTVFIDPYSFGGGDIEHYISYMKSDFKPLDGEEILCAVSGTGNPLNLDDPSNTNKSSIMFGNCDLRTYRLALAATAEYTAFHSGVANAAAAQVTTMNRVNGVYERDFSIRMVIVAGNNALIFTNSATDPYTNNNGSTMLGQNQIECDATIGTADYDIGHVFSTGGGGIASLRSPCSTTRKAQGVTGSGSPTGDPFDIDYVAHEMGHQFGGNHTQYNTCNRNNGTAMEPGSASTIMGYAGICPPNVQNNSDDHFHGITLEEVGDFITNGSTGGSCPVITPLTNNAPTVTGTNAAGVTVPGSTPFMLTATATDPDGNTLSYGWEQMDNTGNVTMPPVSTNTQGPAFRSNSPTTSPTRYFPNLTAIIAGTTPTWEVLASVSRSMNFRVSVRDNAVGGGCTDHTDITINVDGNSGPFVMTYPSNTGITWAGNSTETVLWNEAGTATAPVSCALVDILLSTDGGATYPTVLATGVPNDGSQPVTVPNVASTTARIMVVCSNGTFFDISNNNFTITLATCNVTATNTNVSCNGGSDGTATASATGSAPFGFLWSNGQATATATGLVAGTYSVTLTDGAACNSTTSVVVTEPSALSAAPSATSETCATNDGTATANGSGGTGAISYLWDAAAGSQATNTAVGLSAGSYSVTLTDVNGCTATANATVFNGCCALSIATSGSALTCGGDNNGTVTATPTGTAPYTFVWSGGGQTDATATGLTAGVYTVTVTDGTPCTATETATVTEPSPIVSAPTAAAESCALNDGTATINASGGTGALTFLWDVSAGSQATNTATGLAMGSYNYTITDASGCTSTGLINVPTSCILNTCDTISNINFGTDNITFYTTAQGYVSGHNEYGDLAKADYYNYAGTNTHIQGVNIGFAHATASNATNTFNINVWDGTGGVPGAIIATTSLTYSALVTFLGGTPGVAYLQLPTTLLPASNEFFVGIEFTHVAGDTVALLTNTDTETTPTTAWEQWSDLSWNSYAAWPLTVAHFIEPILGTDPTASFTQSSPTVCTGSTVTYTSTSTNAQTYQWTFPGGTPATSTAANPTVTYNTGGVYDVSLIAINDCLEDTVTMTNTISVTIITSTPTSTPETCTGNDGTATIVASGGAGGYTFLWDAAAGSQVTATAVGLANATYNFTVTDANGCVGTGSVLVADGCVPCTMTATAVATNVNCNGGNDGTATVTPASGTATYTYLWSPGGQTDATATGLTAGTYTVTVTDAATCTATANATVTEPLTALTSAPSSIAETCTGNDGTASANATGGTGALTYLWSPGGQVTATAVGLTFGNYNYTVTDANGCTDIGVVNVTTTCLNGCDTITNIGAADNLTIYTDGASGYVAGHNQYGDIAKADYYNYAGANTHIQGAYVFFGAALASNTTNTFNVNVWDGTGGTPGAIIATTTLTYDALATAGTPGVYYIPFNYTALPATKEFFVGIEYTYAAGDTVALVTNTSPETSPATAWEQWGDLTWHAYDGAGSWGLGVAHDISPVLGILPTAGFSQSSPTVCEGNTITFTNTSTLGQSYEWTFPGGTPATSTAVNPTVTYSTAGAYDVTLIATNDCMADTVVMTNAVTVNSLGATATATNATCNGGSDGTATATSVGGAPTYTFLWSDGQTDATATGLLAATYGVTIKDGNGCEASASAVVAEPSAVAVSAVIDNNSFCNGVADGQATATGSGGTGVITYLWSNGQTNATATGLAANTYGVTATDANACEASVSAVVTEPTAVAVTANVSSNYNGSDISCNGSSDGQATATGSGGTGAITYLWDVAAGSQTTAIATGLAANTYGVTATDANACIVSASVIVSQPTAVAASSTMTAETCAGNDGTATAAGTGGTGAYTFQWDVAAGSQATATAVGLTAGSYDVTITDANGCQATSTATVIDGCVCTMTASATTDNNVSCNGGSDGQTTVTETGGNAPITYLWSNGQTNATATGLGANTYSVTLTDNAGCTATSSSVVTEPVVVAVTASVSSSYNGADISCNGSSDGEATAAGSGGTGAITYLWDVAAGSQTTAIATGLAANTYGVIVTDVNGCTSSASVTVNQPTVVAATMSMTSETCAGNDGTATAAGTGGTGAYTFLWDVAAGSQATATAVGLTAGSYNVTVTDANGCIATNSISVNDGCACPMTASAATDNNVTCNGGLDGQATVTQVGGAPTITYLWSDGQVTATAIGLAANTYTVTVTDAGGCTATGTAIVTEPTAVSLTAVTDNNVSCNGANDGQATATSTGGTGTISYLWSDNQVTAVAVGLVANTYGVTATDASGCTSAGTATVTEPTAVLLTAVTDNNASCNGASDGQATATATGGTGAIAYLWSDGQTTAVATGLVANTYGVTATDANGCTSSTTATVTEPTAVLLTAVTDNNASCNGANDGQATATGSGGTGAITYLWSDGQVTAVATGLVANTYGVTATDANVCTSATTATVTEPTAVALTASVTSNYNGAEISCNGSSDGEATATGSGGTGAITYLWSDGQATAVATGLVANTYGVTATDANGCSSSASVTVNQPTAVSGSSTTTAETCALNDGTATAVATGGTGAYTFLWDVAAGSQVTATAAGLSAGSYDVTITDANGCQATSTATVTDGCVCIMTASASVDNNVSCNGAADGQATVTETGGNPTVTYLWSDGQVTATAVGLAPNTYTVTATDNAGCTATSSVVITEPSAVTIFATTDNNVACNSGSNGQATVSSSGGTGAITYLWSDGQITAIATGLVANTYGVTATDANGCQASTSTVITEPGALTVTASLGTGIGCAGGSDGTASAAGIGGTGSITYLWSDGQATATATGLSANTYTVTATDANGCQATDNVVLTDPAGMTASASVSSNYNGSDISCNGSADGEATVVATGGAGSYTYLWSDGQATAIATGLNANTHTVTITDGSGCTTVTSVALTEPTIVSGTATGTPVNCNGGTDGTATVVAAGGSGSYTYLWSDGQVTATAIALDANTHSVTISDVNGCTGVASVVITQPVSALSALVTAISNPLCNNDVNGSITVNAFGGTTGYTFDIGSGNQPTGVFGGLAGGSYTITVTDANGCTTTAATGLANPSVVNANATVGTAVSCAGNADGTATASAFGGAGSYTYIWSDGQTTGTATGLAANTYTVSATDANGCLATASVTLTDPAAVIASASAGAPITCAGGSDGTANAIGSGGVGALTFLWSNGQTAANATGLNATTHTVTVTDANGCFAIANVTLTNPAGMTATANVTSTYSGQDVSCNGASDGAAIANVSGGATPYTFLWTPSGQTTQAATGLSAGPYVIVINDGNGCSTTANVTLTEPSVVTGTVVDNGDATATATGSGGTAPYTYQWDATAGNQATATATGLINSTTYTVTITDVNGCTTIENVTIVFSGLEGIPNLSLFDVVPNPNTGEFTIRVNFTQAKDATVRLTNVLGQVLREYNYSDATFNIPVDVQHQASGVYFVVLNTNDKSITRKVIVAK